MIRLADVSKRRGQIQAVRNLSFETATGSICGLVGPNGAGKTSTLRMVAGVLPVDSGSIRVGGIDPNVDVASARKLMGVLLDQWGLYGRLTPREHLNYVGRLRGMPRVPLAERIERVIATFGLENLAERRTAGFSQGERLRLALACAVLHEPAYLLLDEPTNGLDPLATRDLRLALRKLRDTGVCIIFSSHVLSEVQSLCDRIVVLANGTALTQGSSAEICNAARTDTLEAAFMKLLEQKE